MDAGEIWRIIFSVAKKIILAVIVFWAIHKTFYSDRRKAKNKAEYDKKLKKSLVKGSVWVSIIIIYVVLCIFLLALPLVFSGQNGGHPLEALLSAMFFSLFCILPIEILVAVIVGSIVIIVSRKKANKKSKKK